MSKKNMVTDLAGMHYDFSHVVYSTSHVFFSPAHLSRKHFLGTTLTQKILNTRDVVFGSEPGAGRFFPLHASKERLEHRQSGPVTVLKNVEYTLKPGLVDVATLGLLIIVPSLIHTIARLASLEWLLIDPDQEHLVIPFVFTGLFIVPLLATALSCILMAVRWGLGFALTLALTPLVTAVHGLCTLINWVGNSANKETKDMLVQMDTAFIQSGVDFNRIDVHYRAQLENDKLIIQPVLDKQYAYALETTEVVYNTTYPEIIEEKREPQELKIIDLSSLLVQCDLNVVREALKIYEQRGLLRLEDNSRDFDDEYGTSNLYNP